MKILFSLILALMFTSPSWAYLTAGKVAVTATSSSSGVPSTSQDSDISDTVGTSVAVAVPVAVTGNINITGVYEVNGTPISATSNWNQVGSTINYAAGNVGIGSTTPGQKLDVVGTVRTTNFTMTGQSPSAGNILKTTSSTGAAIWSNSLAAVLNYGTNTGTSTAAQGTSLIVAYGQTTTLGGGGTFTVTNLPFTSNTSYYCVASPEDTNTENGGNMVCTQGSGSSLTITNNENQSHNINWIAIGT